MVGVFGTVVSRLCRIRTDSASDEDPFPLDDDAFLRSDVPPIAATNEMTEGAFVSPNVAALAGPLILLGEPGLGKTTALEAVATEIRAGGAEVRIVDGVRITDSTFDHLVGRHLRSLPDRGSGIGTPTTRLVLVLDQLDESPMLRRIPAEVEDALSGRDTGTLHLLVACRTADYPTSLTSVLRASIGDCVFADLAPLTRAEAVRLADSAGVVGEDLVSAATAKGAGVLASVPMTLELLVRIYKAEGSLPDTAAEIFQRAIRLSVDEPDDDRRDLAAHSTVEERSIIAARVAARLVLSGRRTVWTGPDLDAGAADVRSGELVGGTERSVGGPFSVSAGAVAATLATALFTGRGEYRLAFRHSSLAAYLVASYLVERALPTQQLKSLFLVAANDGSTSIPEALREAAAWLATLRPAEGAWLVEADPESLANHSVVVDSPEVRSLVVDSLLQHAAEVELRGNAWRRARWRLDHPGLAEQLTNVFKSADGSRKDEWSQQARLRLAVRLAQEVRDIGLVAPLLDIAENDTWIPYLRCLAATAAFATDASVAAPRLKEVLSRLKDATYAVDVDPDDELRGALLEMLWPQELSTNGLVQYLTPRRRRSLFGSYAWFLRSMPADATDDDLAVLISWLRIAAEERKPSPTPPTADDESEFGVEDAEDIPVGAADAELVDAVMEKAFWSGRAEEFIPDIAAIAYIRLRQHRQMQLPLALQLTDADGHEVESSRQLRRQVAHALLKLAAGAGRNDRSQCWALLMQWETNRPSFAETDAVPEGRLVAPRRGLVDATDFKWSLDMAAAAEEVGDAPLAVAFGNVASLLFDPTDQNAIELIYARQRGTAWEQLSWWFAPVDLSSEAAKSMREMHRMSQPRPPEEWAEAQEFAAGVLGLFAAATGGDAAAFWRLLWNLQFDPRTGADTIAMATR